MILSYLSLILFLATELVHVQLFTILSSTLLFNKVIAIVIILFQKAHCIELMMQEFTSLLSLLLLRDVYFLERYSFPPKLNIFYWFKQYKLTKIMQRVIVFIIISKYNYFKIWKKIFWSLLHGKTKWYTIIYVVNRITFNFCKIVCYYLFRNFNFSIR